MKKLIQIITGAFVYFCVATVISLSVAVYVFWSKGGFDGRRTTQILAVLNGLDLYELWKEADNAARVKAEEQPTHHDRLEDRFKSQLDLDLKEQAVRRAFTEMKLLEAQVREERVAFDQSRREFSDELKRRQENATRASLLELQETLSSLKPKPAKDQILMWLDNPKAYGGKDIVGDIVTLIKGMSSDQQAKLFKEFKSEKEIKHLNEILEQIRRGDQEELLKDTKKRLNDSMTGLLPNTPTRR